MKKDGNYLGEHVFLDASRIFKGGTCDWSSILEKSLSHQTKSLKDGKQKLYTCAPIWQELYVRTKKDQQARKPPTGAEPSREAKKRKTGRPDTSRPRDKTPGTTEVPQPNDAKKEG